MLNILFGYNSTILFVFRFLLNICNQGGICFSNFLFHMLAQFIFAMFFRVTIQISQGDFMLKLICMFLGCDLPIQLLLNSLSSV